jgi:lipoate-protein ligase A
MTLLLRVMDTAQRSARWNIAMTAALAELHRTGRIADTVRFHRYPASVLVGRHQDLARAVDLGRCAAANVECARRVTGGGAVYMAPNALAWDIVVARKRLCAQPEEAAQTICTAIAAGLSQLGVPARYRAQNEIEVDGRKLCGSGGYFDGSTLVYQGTVLIDTPLEDLDRFLRLPAGSPQPGRESRSRDVRARHATLREWLGRVPDAAEIVGVIAAALSERLGRRLSRELPSPAEWTLADHLHRSRYGLDSFVYGAPTIEDVVEGGRNSPVH